jgi:hypothetical protein
MEKFSDFYALFFSYMGQLYVCDYSLQSEDLCQ